MHTSIRLAAAFSVSLFLAGQVAAQSRFSDLTRRLPDEANTIILIDVDRIHQTPLAKKEGWRGDHEQAFNAGLVVVPPQANQFVAAGKMDFLTMQSDWQVALVEFAYEPKVAKAAMRYRGTVDSIAGLDIAVLPGDMYAVKFNKSVAAIGAPARRQDVARWITRVEARTLSGPSPYIAEAQKFAETSSQIVMAMDLAHVIPADLVRQRLEKFETLKEKNIDLDAASKAIASIRGITLGILVNESRIGAIKVDFAEDVSSLEGVAKPLLLEALANNGAMINEFRDWKVAVSENQIRITGPLYQSGMRRILSLLDAPLSLQESTPPVPGDASSELQLTIAASQQYFKSITTLLDDLRGDHASAQTMGQIGVWFSKYARKIDRLTILNVDTDLLDYGKYVSESLRTGHSEVQTAAARSVYRQHEVPEQYDVRVYSEPIAVVGGGEWSRPAAYGWTG